MTKGVKNSFLSCRKVVMRRYYLHARNGVFYAALIDQETVLPLTAISTCTRNRDEALLIIADWLKNGIPKRKQKKGSMYIAIIQKIIGVVEISR
jgi:hypothetical protein